MELLLLPLHGPILLGPQPLEDCACDLGRFLPPLPSLQAQGCVLLS